MSLSFATNVPVSVSTSSIDYNSEICSIGSCFAAHMADKFTYFKFGNSCNPFGILFHPLAINNLLQRIAAGETFTEADIFFHNGLWQSFDMHSDCSHSDKEILLQNSNEILQTSQEKLRKATHLIITYGTSWIYRNKQTGKPVANCHKVAQADFDKELLAVETIKHTIAETIQCIQSINPSCKIIFTISPVRHIKDGFVDNQRSKAHLIAALHDQLQSSQSAAIYFPSYEIMMDELRDYRFYASDMLHPNTTAIDYIWERFAQTQIAFEALPIMEAISSIQKGLQHKPFHPDSESHRQFTEKLSQRISQLQQKFPNLEF